MLVKFFSRGSGGGEGPVDYLLGDDRDREGASVLRGNPEITQEIINSTDYAKRYTSGCLSFEEAADDITDKAKAQIMDAFEKTLFAGLESDQYNILWVEHKDKIKTDKNGKPILGADGQPLKRQELNFLIPNQELRSGKRLQPFYHAADLKRVNAFQNVINMRFNYSDPHDPNKRRSHHPYFSRDANLKGVERKDYTAEQERLTTHRSEKNDITEYIYELAEAGRLENRKAIENVIKRQGYKVERVTKRSISVSSPKFGKNIRLDDPIFSEDFRPYDYIPMGIREKQKQYEQDKQSTKDEPSKILREALEVLEEGTRIKAEYHQERFQGIDVPKPFDLGWGAPERAQELTADPQPQPKPKEQNNSPSMGL
jgi:hypothetical protein